MPQDATNSNDPVESFEHAFSDAARDAAAQQAQPPASPPAASPSPPSAEIPTSAGDSPSPSVSPPAQVSPWVQAAEAAGLSHEGLTDEQLAQAVRDYIGSTRPYVSYGQQVAPYADQIREFFERQGQPPSQPAVADEKKPDPDAWDEERYFQEKWDAPKWDDTYTFAIQQGMVQRNADTGLYEATPGYESLVIGLLPGLNQATSFTHKQWQDITRGNPYRQFYDVLAEPLRRQWQTDMQKVIAEEFERYGVSQHVNSFEAENASWMYAIDPQTGNRILTPQGQVFYQEIETLQEAGVTDPQRLITLAMRHISASAPPVAPQSGAPEAVPQPPLVPAPAASPQVASANQQATFLQNALQRAAHSPQAGGYVQPAPDHPVTVDEQELNSMFVTDFRNARGVGPR
jgi:hypothetical protein